MKKLLIGVIVLIALWGLVQVYNYARDCLCEDVWFPVRCYCSNYPTVEGY